MTRITISDAFAACVHDFTTSVELCDQSGLVVGTFVPALHEDREAYKEFKSPISDEEFQQRLAEPGGQSLAEIWKELDAR
jgi:hypothetical protein